MTFWSRFQSEYIPQINILFQLIFHRILYAAIVLSVLSGLIMFVRKKLAPSVRSWLWGLCIPVLFIPFEHGVVTLVRNFYTPQLTPDKFYYFWRMLQNILPYLWLIGFILSALILRINRNNTIRLLKTGEFNGCATYFYERRSHIYLPPNFEKAYTSAEREMLFAHENQHIIQHDPLLYRILQTIQSVFWFNPLVYRAVSCIRNDRELLCDERAICGCRKREYGLFLLRETQKGKAIYTLPGIISEKHGIYERVTACVKPFPKTKKPAILIAGIAMTLFAIGFMGFVKPIMNAPMEIWVSIEQEGEFIRLKDAEKYIILKPDGIALNQKGLINYANSIGLNSDQNLRISVFEAERLTLTSSYTICSGGKVTIKELETENILFPYYDSDFNKPWSLLFKLL